LIRFLLTMFVEMTRRENLKLLLFQFYYGHAPAVAIVIPKE
jgi:hypothetical protein